MKIPKITPEEIGIIKKAQAGDKLAFSKLFNKYKSFVENTLYGYIQDSDEARDIVNIVFLKVYSKLSTFQDYLSFGGWLRTIANRTAIDYLRSKALRKLSYENDDNHLNNSLEPINNERDLINHLTFNEVLAEIKKLPEQNRKINEMYYINNMTVQKISEELRVPIGTVKSVLHRTRKKLRKQFQQL